MLLSAGQLAHVDPTDLQLWMEEIWEADLSEQSPIPATLRAAFANGAIRDDFYPGSIVADAEHEFGALCCLCHRISTWQSASAGLLARFWRFLSPAWVATVFFDGDELDDEDDEDGEPSLLWCRPPVCDACHDCLAETLGESCPDNEDAWVSALTAVVGDRAFSRRVVRNQGVSNRLRFDPGKPGVAA